KGRDCDDPWRRPVEDKELEKLALSHGQAPASAEDEAMLRAERFWGLSDGTHASERGAARAEALIAEWASSDAERMYLNALASGHSKAEARRISGLTHGRADYLRVRIQRSQDDLNRAA